MNHNQPPGKRRGRWAVIVLSALSTVLASVPPGFSQALTPGPTGGAPLQPEAPAAQSAGPMMDIHDIKHLLPLGSTVSPWVYAAIAAGALALAGLVFFLIRKRGRIRATAPSPPRPPDAVALEQLDWIGKAEHTVGRRFYFSLSSVLRDYIQGRFGLNAPEMTTEELLPQVDPLGLPDLLAASLKALLLSADPIKYAGAAATVKKMESDLAFAYTFVHRTTPAGDAPSADDAPS